MKWQTGALVIKFRRATEELYRKSIRNPRRQRRYLDFVLLLGDSAGLTLKQMREVMEVDLSSANHYLTIALNAGYVYRGREGKAYKYYLTESGRAQYKELIEPFKDIIEGWEIALMREINRKQARAAARERENNTLA